MVWILRGEHGEGSFIADVFAHKITAEKALREYQDSDPNHHYWIQEKKVNHEQTY
jgi:hypothetical protein